MGRSGFWTGLLSEMGIFVNRALSDWDYLNGLIRSACLFLFVSFVSPSFISADVGTESSSNNTTMS